MFYSNTRLVANLRHTMPKICFFFNYLNHCVITKLGKCKLFFFCKYDFSWLYIQYSLMALHCQFEWNDSWCISRSFYCFSFHFPIHAMYFFTLKVTNCETSRAFVLNHIENLTNLKALCFSSDRRKNVSRQLLCEVNC